MKDWLGNEYDVGDKIVYAASVGNHGHEMVIAEVVKFNDKTVTVRPIKASRHGVREQTGHVDERTGKPINPYSNRNWNDPEVWAMTGTNHHGLKPHIKQVTLPAKPVALKITKNITRWFGEVPVDQTES